MIYATTPTDPHPPARTLAVGKVRSSHFPHPFSVPNLREFPAWGTMLLSRLLPDERLSVVDCDLGAKTWGLISPTVGVRLSLDRIEAETTIPNDPVYSRFLAIETALGYLVHEAAHAGSWDNTEPSPVVSTERAAEIIGLFVANEKDDAPIDPPWRDGHQADFQRLAIHTIYRAERLLSGFLIEPETVVNNDFYRLSPLTKYAGALGSEPERLVDLPLRTIQGISPPPEFVALWRNDVRKWFGSIREPSKQQHSVMLAAMSLFS